MPQLQHYVVLKLSLPIKLVFSLLFQKALILLGPRLEGGSRAVLKLSSGLRGSGEGPEADWCRAEVGAPWKLSSPSHA